jgi:hypothetical protein
VPATQALLVSFDDPALGATEGEWRPRSWDVSEIAAFAVELSATVGLVRRITLNPGRWSSHPHVLDLPGRQLRIDWFDAAAPDAVSVRRGYSPRLALRLVQPAARRPAPAR